MEDNSSNDNQKIPPKRRNLKGASSEELLKLNKIELIERIVQLEAHNLQLKNIISKSQCSDTGAYHYQRKRAFDFSKCHFRRVLLRISYFGWDYQGFTVQEDTTQTIEHHLFHALTKTCLIESRDMSQYHRCGRTDKGVSAFSQVISILLRSKHPPNSQYLQKNLDNELPYCTVLNRLLPKEIRAIAWMPAPEDRPDFSARFDCKRRLYKYYFPRSDLDVESMRLACSYIVGSHDFRNLCKMDVGNGVTKFLRRILSADVLPQCETDSDSATSMYCFQVEGNAFLWHQIRCIFGVLLLVGQGNEPPEVVRELLDVESNPRKPQYSMALDVPLNLYRCSFEIEEDSKWVYDKEELINLIKHMQYLWTSHSVKTTMIKDCLQDLEKVYHEKFKANELGNGADNESERDNISFHSECLLQGVKPRVYMPLLKRDTCSSLEERIDHYTKKRKLNIEESGTENKEL